MSYTAIENNVIQVDLTIAGNDTGWSLPGDGTAVHVACNSGSITLFEYALSPGHIYQVAWVVTAITSGFVQLQVPGDSGISRNSPGVYIDTVTPDSSGGFITFFANGNCTIAGFTLQDITNTVGTTIVYSAYNKKWSDFRTFYPDLNGGFSLYENTITAKDGQLYFHENGTNNTNNFYGTAYQSIIQAVFAKNPSIINTYEAVSYQANQLLTSTIGGITTPLGQVTTLIDSDFIKQALDDGINQVTIYQANNVYSASFLNDSNDDTVNGNPMKGNYIIVELITVDGSTILKLFSINVRTARTFIGAR